MITSEEIKRRLWEGANDLRGSMDASKYKDYMLGLMFYKFLSDKTLETFRVEAGVGQLSQVELLAEYKSAHEEYGAELENMLQEILGYFVLPDYLYQTWLHDIRTGDFELQKVMDSLNSFERSIAVTGDVSDFKGLFSSSIIDLTNSALGSDLNKRSKNIKDLILLFSDLNMVDLQEGDVLGDAYEYLIAQFASNAGKKAGEFYTPRQVSEVMAQIIAKTTQFHESAPSIYDPTVGSGSLLLTVRKHLHPDTQKDLRYYGQEYITETYNLTRMNLLLHGVRPERMTIKNGNTLAQDWPEDPERPNEGVQFDAVVMNPPYSDKKWNKREDKPLKVSDPRFADFGVLPPDAKGDFAYLLHGLYHLGQRGTMAIVLPHGVLFRGGTEGEIRKRLIEKNQIDAVIGLPSNLFTNTGIPVCILILKKDRELDAPVLIIDASNSFIKSGTQNALQEKDIAKIVDTYVEKIAIAGFSDLASRQKLIENDYNLNIPRYVDAISEDVPHDVDAHLLGGIPSQNIQDLHVLQATVPNILQDELHELRSGYLALSSTVSELTKKVLSDKRVTEKVEALKEKMRVYANKWWQTLKTVDKQTPLNEVREAMLQEMKQILSQFNHLEVYDGYQVIAEIWKHTLASDTELIAHSEFYEVSRTREPHMVTKGSGEKKRLEQEGWNGVIVPNDLIAAKLYQQEQSLIEAKRSRINELDAELEEIRESLSEEDDEYRILNDKNDAFSESHVKAELKESADNITSEEIEALKEYLELLDNKPTKQEKLAFMDVHTVVHWDQLEKSKDGTIAKGKVTTRIAELRATHLFEAGSFEDKLTKIIEKLQEKKDLNDAIKLEEKALKEAIYERILVLTDEEIDTLVYEKWFGNLTQLIIPLVEGPIKKELAKLEMLHERYKDTLATMHDELLSVEQALEELLSDLVVME